MPTVFRITLAIFLIIGAAGCAKTQQAQHVMRTGFIEDYSILQKGEKDEALWKYKNPIADWRKYHKVMEKIS